MHSLGSDAVECDCSFRSVAPAHHDRLVQLERDSFGVLGELIDLASTWGEVECGIDEPAIEPSDWVRFVETHPWESPDRVLELVLGLWSMTLPCSHDVRDRVVQMGSDAAPTAASVTSIGSARSAREAEQSA